MSYSVCVAILLAASGSARGAILTYNWTAYISSATDIHGTPFGLTLSAAETVSGTFTYDLAASPTKLVPEFRYAEYPVSTFEVTVQGTTIAHAGNSVIAITDNVNPQPEDRLQIFTTDSLVSVDGGLPQSGDVTLSFQDFSASTWSSTSLGSLPEFNWYDGVFPPFSMYFGIGDGQGHASAAVTSLALSTVPEPTTIGIWSLFIGLGAFVSCRHRRRG